MQNDTATGSKKMNWDKLGITLSGLCAVHCLFFPAAIALLPLLPLTASMHDWTHPLFFALIVPTVIYALSRSHDTARVAVPLVSGTIIVGVAWILHSPEQLFQEAGLTFAGSALLIMGHWINYKQHLAREKPACQI